MQDILEELDVHDTKILQMHIEKGFMYRDSIIENNDPTDPRIEALERKMFSRMDPEIVFSDNTISPSKRRRFARVRGIACPGSNAVKYYATMFREVCFNLKNNGISYTASLAQRVAKRRNA